MKSKNILDKNVWACAWCPAELQRPLKKGQKYTHGICLMHKAKLMYKYYQSDLASTR